MLVKQKKQATSILHFKKPLFSCHSAKVYSVLRREKTDVKPWGRSKYTMQLSNSQTVRMEKVGTHREEMRMQSTWQTMKSDYWLVLFCCC